MAKLSGFFMSTLLIVLCLWINVCHYPDAARLTPVELPNDAVPVDETRFPTAEPSERADEQPSERPNEKTVASGSARARGLFVGAAGANAPKLLDVSASRSDAENAKNIESAPSAENAESAPSAENAKNAESAENAQNGATPPDGSALKPASFPDETAAKAAEIDDSPAKGLVPPPQSAVKSLSSTPAPASFDVSDVATAPSSATVSTPTPPLASNASPRTKSLRRSATKPRGAKYVRVPDVEIDAFSGSVAAANASDEEIRVVGATRAGQTERVPAPVR